jgi:hypothetical protein
MGYDDLGNCHGEPFVPGVDLCIYMAVSLSVSVLSSPLASTSGPCGL